jgi:hypothetical protein
MARLDKNLIDSVSRAFLRLIPIIPGPEMYDLVVQLTKSQKEVDTQVTEALESLKKTSALVTQLEKSLEERAANLTRLQAEHDRLSGLTKIEAEKAAALLQQVEDTVGRGRGRERWIAFLINLVAGVVIFVLGVILSDSLTNLIRQILASLRGEAN